MKKSKIIIIAIAVVLIVIAAAGYLFYQNGLNAAKPGDTEPVTVSIPSGSGASAIVEILDENGLIKNKTCAKIHVRIAGYDSLQANTYIFNKSMNLLEIMDAINTGNFAYLSKNAFTVIEGATVPQAAEAMAEGLPFTAEEVLKKWNSKKYLRQLIEKYWFLTDEILQSGIMFPLEGYIYPETYFVSDENPSIEQVTEMILDKTEEELTARKGAITEMRMTVHEFLALTSIVENESLFEKDRPIIAGVFVNRLAKDMTLQSDITVLYALQEKRVDVTYEDLEVDSKYNTYKYAGLPVGPVCSPSAPAMDDLLNYEKSDYLYFFATEDGKVLYSKTLEEHNKVVRENMWY
ncbi:MAG: endolytic transglycosylase MltG [Emergencia sp.]|nr:endolytic transglycosylase MltG [Emergencia sp.]